MINLDDLIKKHNFIKNDYVLFEDENIDELVNDKFYLQIFKNSHNGFMFRICAKNRFYKWDDMKHVQYIGTLYSLNSFLEK